MRIDKTIAKLARLARQSGKSFQRAEKVRGAAETLDSPRSSHLREVTSFGSNPGNLRMFTYVPKHLAQRAGLVVVLHGCTQSARSYDLGTGWSTLADRYGFAVLLPEQRQSNNGMRCFNWFKAEHFTRESGEPLSMRQMIEWMIANYSIDRDRVYVNGLSAGGAMTSVMLATYPELFAGGAIIAGMPYRCADGLQEALACMSQGCSRPAPELGTLVKTASSHRGPWPKISVWHGAVDNTVNPANAEEVIKQWTDVHGLTSPPSVEITSDDHLYRVWRGPNGDELVEAYTIAGMSHGVPINPQAKDGCGATAPFVLDMGISSTHHIARFWGLTEEKQPQVAPAPGREVRIDVEPGVVNSAANHPLSRTHRPEQETQDGGEPAPSYAGQKIPAQILNAEAGQSSHRSATQSIDVGNLFQTVDVQKILALSFEAAGLLKRPKEASSDPNCEEGQSTKGGSAGSIDIASILEKSFEAAGLLKR